MEMALGSPRSSAPLSLAGRRPKPVPCFQSTDVPQVCLTPFVLQQVDSRDTCIERCASRCASVRTRMTVDSSIPDVQGHIIILDGHSCGGWGAHAICGKRRTPSQRRREKVIEPTDHRHSTVAALDFARRAPRIRSLAMPSNWQLPPPHPPPSALAPGSWLNVPLLVGQWCRWGGGPALRGRGTKPGCPPWVGVDALRG